MRKDNNVDAREKEVLNAVLNNILPVPLIVHESQRVIVESAKSAEQLPCITTRSRPGQVKIWPTELNDNLLGHTPIFEVLHEPNSIYGTLSPSQYVIARNKIKQYTQYMNKIIEFRNAISDQSNSTKRLDSQFTIESFDGSTEYDNRAVLHFKYWPCAATMFLTRPRLIGWPIQQIRNDIKASGFFMKPRERNITSGSIDWKYSFSEAEDKLGRSLSDVQKTTYIHLELLTNIYFRSPNVLNSYFLKTILFWMCEKVPVSCWRTDNMACMIRLLLDQVIQVFTEGHLEHYFISGANLLDGIKVEHRRTLVKQVKALTTSSDFP